MQKNVICWFRQDLRLSDNPALHAATSEDSLIYPIYIYDDHNPGKFEMGKASQWWLHHSLTSLNDSLGQKLNIYQGDPQQILLTLCEQLQISSVCWNRCYEPWAIQRDQEIKQTLIDNQITVHSHNGSLLWEPWENLKSDGTPYKVFTPFYRKGCLGTPLQPRRPLPAPNNPHFEKETEAAITIDDLHLLPSIPWDQTMAAAWDIGEKAAKKRLEIFIENELEGYQIGRNLPAESHVSRLSPHLHHGEISPNQVWHAAKTQLPTKDVDTFMSELGWREFSYSQLYHFPTLPVENLQIKFNRFKWRRNTKDLKCWQQGQTGIPIVDAGMRELWQTGYMHNRVRMVVGSFLVKNLLLHWHEGEAWFWDCLVDADLASNSASWQWIAGCGADAAPFFRVFNPVLQGKKFDPEGIYTRRFVPELKNMPSKYLFDPWEAPMEVLNEANVVLGKIYPKPIVDLKLSREAALSAFKALKET